MAKADIMDEIRRFSETAGEPGFSATPWYNPHGDCLIYKSEEVAVVAERVDDVLTIYESAETGKAIGFKIKGVAHLLRELGHKVMAVEAATDGTEELVAVSVTTMLLKAFSRAKPTNKRLEGYARAIEQCPGRVTIPTAALA